MAASCIISLPLQNPTAPPNLTVVIVPDFNKDGTATERTQQWLTPMMPSDKNKTRAQLFRFEYRITIKGHSIWRQLIEKGEDLLRTLRLVREKYQNPERPLAFVGYGLGGLIIKRALILFLHPAMQPYGQDALDVVAGVVFFGTPHPKTKQPEQWFRLTLLLNLAGKLPKRFIAQSESDAGTAAAMCDDFEQSGLEAVVLSIYEEKPTRVKSGLLWLKDSVTIVDRAFAETWVKKEKLLGQDAGHEGISDVNPRSVIQQEIGLLLMSALSMRRGRMTAGALQGMNSVDQMELWEDSISQVSSSHRYANDAPSHVAPSHRYDSSVDAALGSSLPSYFDVIPSNDLGEYVEDRVEATTWPCYLLDGFEERRDFVGREEVFKGERGLLELIGWHETRFGSRHTEFKLGYAWHCCGLIYARTGRPNASIAAYNKALANYQATVGSLYHRTGNVCGKIAEHHESLRQFEAADLFFEQAEKAYTSQPHYKPELARHYFIKGQALHGRGDHEAASIAHQKAQALYTQIIHSCEPTWLSLVSLNGIVAPWVW